MLTIVNDPLASDTLQRYCNVISKKCNVFFNLKYRHFQIKNNVSFTSTKSDFVNRLEPFIWLKSNSISEISFTAGRPLALERHAGLTGALLVVEMPRIVSCRSAGTHTSGQWHAFYLTVFTVLANRKT